MRWLITNRNQEGNGFGSKFASLTYWTASPVGGTEDQPVYADLTQRSNWTPCTATQFKNALVAAVAKFPPVVNTPTATQKHVTMFIHGYNSSFEDGVSRVEKISSQLFEGPDSLGELVSFDWPSEHFVGAYLPDRAQARKTGDDLTNVLSVLYDWMLAMQTVAFKDPSNACRARTSIIAHSMGNYALEYATNALWTRKNRPLLSSMMQEVLMVAADVDNDLFKTGEAVAHGDGEGLSNLSYRITALYTGRDDVLGASAGLKHFGKRRLGRSGLDRTYPLPDNVWDVDCTPLWADNDPKIPKVNGISIHGEYFEPQETRIYALIRSLLEGTDRSVLIHEQLVPAALMKTQPTPSLAKVQPPAAPAG
jgi:esterase/lipase superfamily enzyme